MALNLKHISYSDSDNLKLDKVNYNFDQIVANGGGPQGEPGLAGAQGHQGITGYQGHQGIPGPQGVQGPQGNNGEDVWIVNEGNAPLLNTMLPKHDGDNPGAPSVVIGYKTTDPQYTQIEEYSALVVNRSGNFQNNLELRSSDVPGNSFIMKLGDPGDGSTRQTLGFLNPGGELKFSAEKFTWSVQDGASFIDKLTLDQTSFEVTGVDSVFSDVIIDGTLKINSGNPGLNKIAVSADSEGTIEFKSISEIGGVVPVGSIISLNPSVFTNNQYFYNAQTTIEADSNGLKIRMGAGKAGQSWAGWYLCNGRTWTDGLGNSYPTPNLNSFTYTIQADNSGNQYDVQDLTADDLISVLGGIDVDMDADYTVNSWDISHTVNSNDLTVSVGSGSTIRVVRLPKVIFLGDTDLYWQHQGVAAQNYSYSTWLSNGGSYEISESNLSNSGGSWGSLVTITQANDGSSASFDANVNSSTAPTNPGSASTVSGFRIRISIPTGEGWDNESEGYVYSPLFSLTQNGGYVAPNPPSEPSTYTHTYNFTPTPLQAGQGWPTVTVSFTGTLGQTSQNMSAQFNAPSDYYFAFEAGQGIQLQNSVQGLTWSLQSTNQVNPNGTIVGKIHNTQININQALDKTVDITYTAIATENPEVTFYMSLDPNPLAGGDSDFNLTSASSYTYSGRPGDTFNIPVDLEYEGTGNVQYINPSTGIIVSENDNDAVADNISSYSGSGNGPFSFDIPMTLGAGPSDSSIPITIYVGSYVTPSTGGSPGPTQTAPTLSVGNLSTAGQTVAQPGGVTNTLPLTVNVNNGLPWTLTGPTWVTYTPDSGTGTGDDQAVQVTIDAPTSGSFNSDRTGTTTISTQSTSTFLAGSATGVIEQDNTFFTMTGSGWASSIGSEGDSLQATLITNMSANITASAVDSSGNLADASDILLNNSSSGLSYSALSGSSTDWTNIIDVQIGVNGLTDSRTITITATSSDGSTRTLSTVQAAGFDAGGGDPGYSPGPISPTNPEGPVPGSPPSGGGKDTM